MARLSDDNGLIVDVWSYNLESEILRIREIVDDYPYVSLDTEFPGVYFEPSNRDTSDYAYQKIRENVNKMNMIQLGLSFQNERGQSPPGPCCWQFNFDFNIHEEEHLPASIEFLRKAGFSFDDHIKHGIDKIHFGELIISSGLIMNQEIQWVSFHGCYDFAYFLKILTGSVLPYQEPDFFSLLYDYFPSIYDVKMILHASNSPFKYFSLQKIAEVLSLHRYGNNHQAGSDALLTSTVFFTHILKITSSTLMNHSKGKIFGVYQKLIHPLNGGGNGRGHGKGEGKGSSGDTGVGIVDVCDLYRSQSEESNLTATTATGMGLLGRGEMGEMGEMGDIGDMGILGKRKSPFPLDSPLTPNVISS